MQFEKVDPDVHTVTFGFVWDKYNPNFNPNPEYQALFFRAQENYINDRLKAGRFITVNDVADMLGFSRTPRGMVYGWNRDEKILFIIRRNDEGTVTLELIATNIYEQMTPRPTLTQNNAPVGTVATLGHPGNMCLIVRANDGWRHLGSRFYKMVDPEEFRGGWDLYDPFKNENAYSLVEIVGVSVKKES